MAKNKIAATTPRIPQTKNLIGASWRIARNFAAAALRAFRTDSPPNMLPRAHVCNLKSQIEN